MFQSIKNACVKAWDVTTNAVTSVKKTVVVAGIATVTAVTTLTSHTAMAAEDPEVAAMFASVDMSDLKVKVAALLMATLLIPLMFVGAALVKKTIRSARG